MISTNLCILTRDVAVDASYSREHEHLEIQPSFVTKQLVVGMRGSEALEQRARCRSQRYPIKWDDPTTTDPESADT
jgi:hypothetical protein